MQAAAWSSGSSRVPQRSSFAASSDFRALPAKSAVHIARCADYDADLADILQRQFEHFRAEVPLAGKRVVLKPNLVEYHRDKVINTDPRVVAAVIELCQREGAAEVIVAEGPGHWRNVEYLVADERPGRRARASTGVRSSTSTTTSRSRRRTSAG